MSEKEKERIKLEMTKIASEIRRLNGKIGGLKAHYNKLRDRLEEDSK